MDKGDHYKGVEDRKEQLRQETMRDLVYVNGKDGEMRQKITLTDEQGKNLHDLGLDQEKSGRRQIGVAQNIILSDGEQNFGTLDVTVLPDGRLKCSITRDKRYDGSDAKGNIGRFVNLYPENM